MTQPERLLAALRRKPMTSLEIVTELGIVNTTGRISDLRKDGYIIECRKDEQGHDRYYLRERRPVTAGEQTAMTL